MTISAMKSKKTIWKSFPFLILLKVSIDALGITESNLKYCKSLVKALKKRKLDPESLALGEMMIHSSKAARDIDEWGYHRYNKC